MYFVKISALHNWQRCQRDKDKLGNAEASFFETKTASTVFSSSSPSSLVFL